MRRAVGTLVALLAVVLGPLAGDAGAATSVPLREAGSFGVLAGTSVPNTGLTVIDGDLGVSPGSSVTGSPTLTAGHGLHENDALAIRAHADLVAAYADVAAQPASEPAITGDLGGQTLGPGVHASAATLAITGKLTLDAGGNPSAQFVLRAGSTLGSAALSEVVLANGAQACNVYWQVGTDATLAANSSFSGTILATGSLTLGAGMNIAGRALARDGAVTMDSTTITVPTCSSSPLTNTAPTITPFAVTLTGLTQTVRTAVGAWSVTDPTGSNAGYSVTVAASDPTVGGSEDDAGTGGSLTLTPRSATPKSETRPVKASPQTLNPIASTIQNAPATTGQGRWEFPADSGSTQSLEIVVGGDAGAGAYSSTLTFTTAPPVSP